MAKDKTTAMKPDVEGAENLKTTRNGYEDVNVHNGYVDFRVLDKLESKLQVFDPRRVKRCVTLACDAEGRILASVSGNVVKVASGVNKKGKPFKVAKCEAGGNWGYGEQRAVSPWGHPIHLKGCCSTNLQQKVPNMASQSAGLDEELSDCGDAVCDETI